MVLVANQTRIFHILSSCIKRLANKGKKVSNVEPKSAEEERQEPKGPTKQLKRPTKLSLPVVVHEVPLGQHLLRE